MKIKLNDTQTFNMAQAFEKMNKVKDTLDKVMFRSGDINDEAYNKVREIYDQVCDAIDKMYNL